MEQNAVAFVAFEEMAPEARAEAARAASMYLLAHDFVSLEDACERHGLTFQQLWDEIMAGAELPPCGVPVFAFAT